MVTGFIELLCGTAVTVGICIVLCKFLDRIAPVAESQTDRYYKRLYEQYDRSVDDSIPARSFVGNTHRESVWYPAVTDDDYPYVPPPDAY